MFRVARVGRETARRREKQHCAQGGEGGGGAGGSAASLLAPREYFVPRIRNEYIFRDNLGSNSLSDRVALFLLIRTVMRQSRDSLCLMNILCCIR